MSFRVLSILLASTLCLTGCGDQAPSAPASTANASVASPVASSAAPAASPAAAGHATASVAPGSHEDWCGEHQVPESQCTRCNASLIPAFKATKDWCAEHTLPESQCLKCNPTLKIVRPPPGAGK